MFKCPIPKKKLERLVVAQNNSESSMKYHAEADAMSEDLEKLLAEQNARAGWRRARGATEAGVMIAATIKSSESLKTNPSKPLASEWPPSTES